MNYKEILKGIVNIIQNTKKSDIGFVEICSYIDDNCPELKESEDERIRKALIEIVQDTPENDMIIDYNVYRDETLAWLEKQCEKTSTIVWHSNSDTPNENEELLCEWESSDATWHDVAFYHADTKTFWNGKEQIENVTRWFSIDSLLEKQGEKSIKPTETIEIPFGARDSELIE